MSKGSALLTGIAELLTLLGGTVKPLTCPGGTAKHKALAGNVHARRGNGFD